MKLINLLLIAVIINFVGCVSVNKSYISGEHKESDIDELSKSIVNYFSDGILLASQDKIILFPDKFNLKLDEEFRKKGFEVDSKSDSEIKLCDYSIIFEREEILISLGLLTNSGSNVECLLFGIVADRNDYRIISVTNKENNNEKR